jgi:hypothetical protein
MVILVIWKFEFAGASPTIVSYNTSAVKTYIYTPHQIARRDFKQKYSSTLINKKKHPSLLQRQCCG